MRAFLILLHRYLGRATAVFLLLAGITGAFRRLTYTAQDLDSTTLKHMANAGCSFTVRMGDCQGRERWENGFIGNWRLYLVALVAGSTYQQGPQSSLIV